MGERRKLLVRHCPHCRLRSHALQHPPQAGLDLPPVLDATAATGLLEALQQLRGQALALDGGAVQLLGGQCLQVLLAARAAWEADGQNFALTPCSEDFQAALARMGVAPEALTYRREPSA
jgi:chemotaxis protein CheX